MTDLAAEIAAIFEARDAELRAQAIAQTNKQRLTFVRPLGSGQIVCEMVIEEAETAETIYAKLANVEAAADRLKAKVDLSDHYSRVLGSINQIEMARKKLAEMVVESDAKRAAASINRRNLVEISDADKIAQRQQRDSIKTLFENIDETQKAIAECKRILDGEDPFEVVAEQIAERLDRVRGSRGAAAA